MAARSFSAMNVPLKSPVKEAESSAETMDSPTTEDPKNPDICDAGMDCVRWMGDYVPVFGISGSKVHIIQEPAEFYQALKVTVICSSGTRVDFQHVHIYVKGL